SSIGQLPEPFDVRVEYESRALYFAAHLAGFGAMKLRLGENLHARGVRINRAMIQFLVEKLRRGDGQWVRVAVRELILEQPQVVAFAGDLPQPLAPLDRAARAL